MKRFIKGFIIGIIIILLVGGGFYVYKDYTDKQKIKQEEEAQRLKQEEHENLVRETLSKEVIYDGISIGGVDVSGLSKSDAESKLRDKFSGLGERKIVVYIDDSSATKTLAELGLNPNFDAAINKAYQIGRDGTEEERFNQINSLKENKENIDLSLNVDEEKVKDFVNTISANMNVVSTNSDVTFVDGKLQVGESKSGKEVDKEELLTLLNTNIKKAINENNDVSFETKTKTIEPSVNKDAIARVNGVIGTFTSNLGRGTAGRNANIVLSAKRISNIVVMPSETVSFNQKMGPITEANGYKQASTIQGGVYTDALGGGLCQTSTTLYNALVRSDVTITERHPHSIPAPYVPYGEDGAVWVGAKDLKFTNNFDFPIAITSSVNLAKNIITFTIYGDTNKKNYTVEMYSKCIEEIPFEIQEKKSDELFVGETKVVKKGRPGYRYQSYKVYKNGGKLIKEVPYMKSYYPKSDQVVLVGTKTKTPDSKPTDMEDIPSEEPVETIDLLQ